MAQGQVVSVTAVLKGLNSFLSGMGKIRSGMGQVGQAARSLQDQLEKVGVGYRVIERGGSQIVQFFDKTSNRFVSANKAAQALQITLSQLQGKLKSQEQLGITKGLAATQNVFKALNAAIGNVGLKLTKATKEGKDYVTFQDKATGETITAAEAAERLGVTLDQLAQSYENARRQAKSMGGGLPALGGGGAGGGGLPPIVGGTLGFLGRLGKAAVNVGGIITRFSLGVVRGILVASLRAGQLALNLLGQAFNILISPITNAINSIKRFVSRVLTIASGIIVSNTFYAIIDAVKSATGAISENIREFQKLEVRLDTLLAREQRLVDETLNVRDSYLVATASTKELTSWITRLSITQPFDVNDIATTNAFSMAMGFASGEAKGLTESVLTYSAGMGLSSEVMERIIFNFGQMKAAGKVTATEMRDLARGAFFPLTDVLDEAAKMLNVSSENMLQFRKEASEGAIDINVFFRAFQNVVQRDFPGAVERMANTFDGLVTRIKNLVKAVGREALGPTFEAITTTISEALKKIDLNELLKRARIFGFAFVRSLGLVYRAIRDELIPALGELARSLGLTITSTKSGTDIMLRFAASIRVGIRYVANATREVANWLSKNLGGIASQAQQWGSNLIISFARGMISAITYVVSAISRLVSSIAYWLKAQSPPRALPLIRRWGAAAMTEYIKGWGEADFSLFNSIADKVEAFFRSIPGGIGKDNIGLVPRILGTREAIVKAINGIRDGFLTVDDAIKQVLATGKGLSKEFSDYIRALINMEGVIKLVKDAQEEYDEASRRVAEASKKVKLAQDEVNAIEERYAKILDELNKQLRDVTEVYDEQQRLREIDAAIATGLLTTAERERLEMEKRALLIKKQIRGVEDQRDAEVAAGEEKIKAAELAEQQAIAEQERLELALEAAKAQEEAARSQLAAAEALIDFQIKQNELINEQLELLKRLAEARKGGGADEPAQLGIPTIPLPVMPNQRELFNRAEEDSWNQYLIWKRMQEILAEVEAAFANLGSTISTELQGPLTELTTAIESLRTSTEALIEQRDKVAEMTRSILGLFQFFGTTLGAIFSSVTDTIGGVVETVGELLGVDLTFSFSNAFEAIRKSSYIFIGALALIASIVTAFFSGIASAVTFIAENSARTWEIISDGSRNLVERIFLGALGIITTVLGAIVFAIVGFGKGFIDFWVNLYNKLVKHSIIPDMMNDIRDVIVGALEWIQEKWEEIWENLRSWVETKLQAARTTVETKMEEIRKWVDTKLSEVKSKWEEIWEGLRTFVNDKLTGPEGIVTKVKASFDEIVLMISETMTNAFNTFKDSVLTPLTTAFDALKTVLSGLWSWLKQVVDAIKNLDLNKLLQLLGLKKGDTPDGKQHGGATAAGRTYWVGEAGPELFTSSRPGYIMTLEQVVGAIDRTIIGALMTAEQLAVSMLTTMSVIDRRLVNRDAGAMIGGAQPTVVNTYYNVEVNPTYRNVQSEASVYYDALAALNSVRR